MSKKSKKEKQPTFPQSVAVRFDSEDDGTDALMLAEKTAEDHGDMNGPVTVGVYELKKIVRVEARSVVTIITHDAKGK